MIQEDSFVLIFKHRQVLAEIVQSCQVVIRDHKLGDVLPQTPRCLFFILTGDVLVDVFLGLLRIGPSVFDQVGYD